MPTTQATETHKKVFERRHHKEMAMMIRHAVLLCKSQEQVAILAQLANLACSKFMAENAGFNPNMFMTWCQPTEQEVKSVQTK